MKNLFSNQSSIIILSLSASMGNFIFNYFKRSHKALKTIIKKYPPPGYGDGYINSDLVLLAGMGRGPIQRIIAPVFSTLQHSLCDQSGVGQLINTDTWDYI